MSDSCCGQGERRRRCRIPVEPIALPDRWCQPAGVPSLIVLALTASALNGCRTPYDEGPTLCPARLPALRWVAVDSVGQGTRWNTADEPPCERFRPTAADIRRFLGRAERTSSSSVHYTLAESPCHATGRLRFAGGQVGHYRITRLSLMHLTIGREPEIILYCEKCRFGGLEEG